MGVFLLFLITVNLEMPTNVMQTIKQDVKRDYLSFIKFNLSPSKHYQKAKEYKWRKIL